MGISCKNEFYYAAEEAERQLDIILEKGELAHYEATLKRRDNGERVVVLATAQLYSDNSGKIIGIEGIFSDITERKKVEEALEEERGHLEKAIREVRTLQGILPICSKCKKIRNDSGFWEQVEKYVSEHTDAIFSHGICPDCAKELYPELYKDK